MATYIVDFQCSNGSSRQEVRNRVIDMFKLELPGTGTSENSSKYRYDVEILSDGNKIFLTRPANLNKGFDFVINVENQRFSNNRTFPPHHDIFKDLEIKKSSNPVLYEDLYKLIKKFYDSNDVHSKEFEHLSNLPGYPIDMVLGVIKWFFIEQDITYWNWSGRTMFMNGVPLP